MEPNQMKKNIFKTLFKKGHENLSRLVKKNKVQEDLIDTESNKECTEEEMLIQSLKEAKNEWLNADMNFQYVSEDEFIEYYTYKLKAAQIKYEFFLRKAKEKGLKLNIGSDIVENNTHSKAGKNAGINENPNTYISNSSGINTSITSNAKNNINTYK